MRQLMIALLGIYMGTYSYSAYADDSIGTTYEQCTLMPTSYVEQAQKLLKEGLATSTWCALCGDEKPGPVEVIASVEFVEEEDNFHSVHINGKRVDAAYLYIYNNGIFTNFGDLYYCNPVGVSKHIYAWKHILDEVTRIKVEEAKAELASRQRR